MKQEAAKALSELLGKMGLAAEVVAEEHPDHIALEVRGPETGLVVGKRGATLEAIQYLVNKLVPAGEEGAERQGARRPDKPIYVDAEGYRERRAEQLRELAQQLAEKARGSKRPVRADAMSPADRRVVHLALADSADIATRSEGEGADRRLVVFLK